MSTHQSVFDFLNISSSFASINKTRLQEIRSSHQIFLSETGNSAIPTSERVLRHLATQYNLLDDATNIDHLRLCVQNATNLDLACHELVSAFNRMQFTRNSEKRRQANKISQLCTNLYIDSCFNPLLNQDHFRAIHSSKGNFQSEEIVFI